MKQLPTLQQILGKIYKEDTAPRTLIDNIHITQDDIEGDLHEGRD